MIQRMLKRKVWKGGSISVSRFGRGSRSARGSKSAVTPGQRIESFEILPAILGNPRLQGNFDRDMEKKYNSYWYNLKIRTLQETLEMRWRYLLTATAQGKRRGSKRKPN